MQVPLLSLYNRSIGARPPAGRISIRFNRFCPDASNALARRGNVLRPRPKATRFWIIEVMKTVLPARLRPVTAMRTTVSLIDASADAPAALASPGRLR